jgi:hypothetical protein
VKTNLTIMSTTSVDSDTPTYEIWGNDVSICEIGITKDEITVGFCQVIEPREINLEELLVKLNAVWNKLQEYRSRDNV